LGGSWNHDWVETVRQAGDLVRLISDHVPLKARGARLLGLCPFHEEKTPSFSVDPKAQLFYCFGCHTGGDLFKFVQLYERVDFRESVEILARRWGVPLPAAETGAETARRRLLELTDAAEAWFRSRLADPEGGRRAREYVAARGLREETATRLGLGLAPDAWDGLRTHLSGKRFRPDEIVSAGLALPRKQGPGEYDRFRDRLIFPIHDVNGRTVAFGGRALGDGEPKYLNSPETPIYVKGEHLYGLDLAREAIRREGLAVVVEGYMDLAAALQAGTEAVVATLGTAFTPGQAKLLARFTTRVVVSYDGDRAGVQAAARSLDVLLGRGFEVRILELPGGLDPDDFIRKEGAEAYARRLQQAPAWLEFLLERERRSRDLTRIEERVAGINALLPHLAKLPTALERAAWAGQIADALQVDDHLVLTELKAALKDARPAVRLRPPEDSPRLREAETGLVRALLSTLAEKKPVEMEIVEVEGTTVASIIRTMLQMSDEGLPVSAGSVFSALESESDRDLLTRIAVRQDEEEEPGPEALESCLATLRKERWIREGKALQKEIERAATDPIARDALLRRKQELARRIDALS
jgi:DNA primase